MFTDNLEKLRAATKNYIQPNSNPLIRTILYRKCLEEVFVGREMTLPEIHHNILNYLRDLTTEVFQENDLDFMHFLRNDSVLHYWLSLIPSHLSVELALYIFDKTQNEPQFGVI